ncbi:hypothetical protein Bccel_0844 [Pseudobacteroides cellulosolvens ATCC 35603 = DSM 2933]|uniref:Uncharacterized protein n=1 Tax=Pseudobacteroides cellulosolvens ATCC 35603 = DSM 2933 TaxID=398512 RepID=A0A0L6JIL5_9FIRM|nr:hypothetical protein Bccel_0844 [Pseudobacteroides cellulosolvens ATCC 35603 = DSM 2933]
MIEVIVVDSSLIVRSGLNFKVNEIKTFILPGRIF